MAMELNLSDLTGRILAEAKNKQSGPPPSWTRNVIIRDNEFSSDISRLSCFGCSYVTFRSVFSPVDLRDRKGKLSVHAIEIFVKIDEGWRKKDISEVLIARYVETGRYCFYQAEAVERPFELVGDYLKPNSGKLYAETWARIDNYVINLILELNQNPDWVLEKDHLKWLRKAVDIGRIKPHEAVYASLIGKQRYFSRSAIYNYNPDELVFELIPKIEFPADVSGVVEIEWEPIYDHGDDGEFPIMTKIKPWEGIDCVYDFLYQTRYSRALNLIKDFIVQRSDEKEALIKQRDPVVFDMITKVREMYKNARAWSFIKRLNHALIHGVRQFNNQTFSVDELVSALRTDEIGHKHSNDQLVCLILNGDQLWIQEVNRMMKHYCSDLLIIRESLSLCDDVQVDIAA